MVHRSVSCGVITPQGESHIPTEGTLPAARVLDNVRDEESGLLFLTMAELGRNAVAHALIYRAAKFLDAVTDRED